MSATSIYVMNVILFLPLMVGLEAMLPQPNREDLPRWPIFVARVTARFGQFIIVFVTGYIAGGEFIKQLYGVGQ